MSSEILWKTSWAYYLKHPFYLLVLLFSIIWGAAAIVSIDIAIQSSLESYRISESYLSGHSTHFIHSDGRYFSEKLYSFLKKNSAFSVSIAPVLEDSFSHKEMNWEILGIDPVSERLLRPYLLRVSQGSALDILWADGYPVLIFEETSKKYQLNVGDTIPFQTKKNQYELQISGIIETKNKLLEETFQKTIIMDIFTAQKILDKRKSINKIYVNLKKPSDEQKVSQEMTRFFSSNQSLLNQKGIPQIKPRLISKKNKIEIADSISQSYRLNLTALSFLTLLVGLFIIYNTIYFLTLKRRPLYELLRKQGVFTKELTLLILGESILLGILGATAGIPLGVYLSRFLLEQTAQTFQDHYFQLRILHISYSMPLILKNYFITIASTGFTGFISAFSIARKEVLESNKISTLENIKKYKRLFIFAAVMFLTGQILEKTNLTIQFIPEHSKIFASFFLQFIGLLCCMPLLFAFFITILQRLRLSRKTILFTLPVSILKNNTIRISVLIMLLAVSSSTAVSVETFVNSFRSTLVQWLETTVSSDIIVSSQGYKKNIPIPAEWQKDPSVFEIRTIFIQKLMSDYGEITAKIPNTLKGKPFGNIHLIEGDFANIPGRTSQPYIIISENLKNKKKLSLNQTIRIQTARGWQKFTVGGIYRDYSSEKGFLLIPFSIYARHWKALRSNQMMPPQKAEFYSWGIRLDSAESIQRYKAKIKKMIQGKDHISMESRQGLLEKALVVFDRTFRITDILTYMVLFTAFVGALSVFFLLQNYESQTFYVLNVIGVSFKEMIFINLVLLLLIAVITSLISFIPALWMSYYLIEVINVQSFGWSLDWSLSMDVFLKGFMVLPFAGFVALFVSQLSLFLRSSRGLRNDLV